MSLPAENNPETLENLQLVGQQSIAISKLSGFRKAAGHFVPEHDSQATENFLARISTTEVEQDIDDLFQRLRTSYRFKRKELSATVTETGGSILTPYFEYAISVHLHPDDVSQAVLQRRLFNIKEINQILCREFSESFAERLNTLEIRVQKLDLPTVIDQIEEADSQRIILSYNKELTSIILQVAGLDAELFVTPELMTVRKVLRQQNSSVIDLIHAYFTLRKIIKAEMADSDFPL